MADALPSPATTHSVTTTQTVTKLLRTDGTDYATWRYTIIAALAAKDMDDVLTTAPTKASSSSSNDKDVLAAQAKAVLKAKVAFQAIWMGLSDELKRQYVTVQIGDAYGLWKAITRKFESKTEANKMMLAQRLDDCRMSDDEPFDGYLARMMDIATQIRAAGDPITDRRLMSRLLRGLPDRFEHTQEVVALQIEASGGAAWDFDRVCEHIRNVEEKHLLKKKQEDAADAAVNLAAERTRALYSNGNGRGGRGGMNGGRGGGRPTNGGSCFTCGVPGHRKFDCPENKSKKRCESCRTVGSHTTDECYGSGNRQRGRGGYQRGGGSYRPTTDGRFGNGNGGTGGYNTDPSYRQERREHGLYTGEHHNGYQDDGFRRFDEHRSNDEYRYGNRTDSSSEERQNEEHYRSSYKHQNRHEHCGIATEDHVGAADSVGTGMESAMVSSTVPHSVNSTSTDPTSNAPNRHTTVNTCWILDSGATSHFTNDRGILFNMRKILPVTVHLANGTTVTATEAGQAKVTLEHQNDFGNTVVTLREVLYVPSFAVSLLSTTRMVNDGCVVTLHARQAVVRSSDGAVIMVVPKRKNLYMLHGNQTMTKAYAAMVPSTIGTSADRLPTTDRLPTSNPHPSSNRPSADQPMSAARPSGMSDTSMQKLWHDRLGHIGYDELRKLVKADAVIGIDIKNVRETDIRLCEPCVMGKSTRRAFHKHMYEPAKTRMDCAHADLAGPIGGSPFGRYLLTITDERSRYITGVILQRKSDAADAIIEWHKKAKATTGLPLKEFHSDGGGEFVSRRLLDYWKVEGTQATTTTKATPQHNAIAERGYGKIFNKSRSMMIDSKVPAAFWPYAVQQSIRVLNVCLTSSSDSQTPYQLWRDFKPDVRYIKKFGCNAYVNVQKQDKSSKMDPNARRGIHVGWDFTKDGYKIIDIETGKMIISRDVRFDESSCSFAQTLGRSSGTSSDSVLDAIIDDIDIRTTAMENVGRRVAIGVENDRRHNRPNEVDETNDEESVGDDEHLSDVDSGGNENATSDESHIQQNHMHDDEERKSQFNPHPFVKVEPSTESDHRAASHRIPSVPIPSSDQVHRITRLPTESASVRQSEPRASRRPPNRYGMVDRRDLEHAKLTNGSPSDIMESAFAAAAVTKGVPRTYKEAVNGGHASKWMNSMKSEVTSLQENGTWELVDLPPGKNLVSGKWVYVIKENSDGSIERYKSRWTARGFDQVKGIDYTETFSPVVRMDTLRMMMAYVATDKKQMKHLDVTTAFLNAPVKEELYVEQPHGFEKGNKVCRLRKALYGIKQAPHEWNKVLNAFLVTLGYRRCRSDTCLYYKKSRTGRNMYIMTFVDDIIPIYDADDESEYIDDRDRMMKEYKMKDLGDAEWLLGMKVTRDVENRYLSVTQGSYIRDVLSRFGMEDAKPARTPASGYKLSLADCNADCTQADRDLYMSMVGSLMYAAVSTRPDIAHAVGMVCRYMQNPGAQHFAACKRILRYLVGTKDKGLEYYGDNRKGLSAYGDADWAGDVDDWKSTTGYIIMLYGCTVGWITKKQTTVSLSSTEAEYMSMSATVQHIQWMHEMLAEGDLPVFEPTKLYCDNQSAIQLSSNDVNHSRSKHIPIRHHYIRDAVQAKEFEVRWIPTADQLADIMTKSLGFIAFERLRERIMNGCQGTYSYD